MILPSMDYVCAVWEMQTKKNWTEFFVLRSKQLAFILFLKVKWLPQWVHF